MYDFLYPQAPVSGTRSPVLLPCFPSIGVPVPLRLPKSTFQKKIHSHFFVLRRQPQAPAHQSCHPVSLVSRTPHMHFVCALVRMAGAGCSAVLGSLSSCSDSSPPTWSWGEGHSGPAGLGFVSYPLCKALSSRTGVDVVWILSCVLWSLF